MADYTNLLCPVCKEKFSPEDDIVVCPICGTPHHRACYAKEGRCANYEWHKENKTYNIEEELAKLNSEQREQAQGGEGEQNSFVICPRCGTHNDSQAIFCNKCGAPISNGFGAGVNGGFGGGQFGGAMPFANPFVAQNENELIDGVEAWKFASVVKENKLRFLFNFKSLSQRKRKTSFNFAAFFFAPFYFLYRKMYGVGIAAAIVMLVLNIPSVILSLTNEYLSEIAGTTITYGLDLSQASLSFVMSATYICSLLITAVRIVCGLFANWLYFKKCKKIVASIDAKATNRDEFVAMANKKGGANKVLIIVLIAIYMVLIWTVMFMGMNPGILG